MFGNHNVQNALAAIAIANEMDVSDEVLRRALEEFEGVNRRFTRTGSVDGITIIDDYGHHPVEIAAVLGAARTATTGQIIAVVQPHRFSRLRDLFEDFCSCFNDADIVLVSDVYSAGEDPIEGIDRDALIDGLRAHGHRHALALPGPDNLAAMIGELAHPERLRCLPGGGQRNPVGARIAGGTDATPRWRGRGEAMMAASNRIPPLIARLPTVRGRYTENVALGPITWFRVGGPAEVMFRPADTADLTNFLTSKPSDVPVTVLGVGSNLLVRDGGGPRRRRSIGARIRGY